MSDLQDLLSCKAELDAKISKVEVELSALREKVSFFTVIYNKFDETLSKVQEMMEDRRNQTNDDLKDVYKKIEDTETHLTNELRLLREEMRRQHDVESKKIQDLDRWRWWVMGAAAVIGAGLSKMVDFLK
jgi:peptidoglycan hydrolase CwlO-like protein